MGSEPTLGLSVVVPIFNEEGVLRELARRCCEAAAATGLAYEVVLVDDASQDDTRATAARLDLPGLRLLHLPNNRGQFGATCEGLRATRGRVVVVLDGDLQDPPETMVALVAALDAQPDAQVAFAQKVSRVDPLWFRVGRMGFHLLQRLGKRHLPGGVGSFCAMRRELADRASQVPLASANLASVLASLDASHCLVPYSKQERHDGRSRAGLMGLVREALGSLYLTGALQRLAWLTAGTLALLLWWAMG